MIKTPVVVKTDSEFDGRPIALLVQEASQYASKIYIQVEGKNINAKSIMGMMSLALANGGQKAKTSRKRRRGSAVSLNGVQNNLKRQKRRAVPGRSTVLFCFCRREVYVYEENAVHL